MCLQKSNLCTTIWRCLALSLTVSCFILLWGFGDALPTHLLCLTLFCFCIPVASYLALFHFGILTASCATLCTLTCCLSPLTCSSLLLFLSSPFYLLLQFPTSTLLLSSSAPRLSTTPHLPPEALKFSTSVYAPVMVGNNMRIHVSSSSSCISSMTCPFCISLMTCFSCFVKVAPAHCACHGFVSDISSLCTVWWYEFLFPCPGSCALVTHDPGFVLFILRLPCILYSLVFPVCHLLCTAFSCSCARDGAPCTYLWLLLYLQFVYCISWVAPVCI